MLQLIRSWFDICLLRRAPQDLPASNYLLGLSLCCYSAVSVLVSAQGYEFSRALLLAVVDLGLLVFFVWMLLYLQGMSVRFGQTLSAMAGTGSIMGLVALPLLVMAGPATVSGPVPGSLVSLWLLLLLWNLLVMAHIIRHALSTTLLVGFGFSMLYAVISMQVITALFP